MSFKGKLLKKVIMFCDVLIPNKKRAKPPKDIRDIHKSTIKFSLNFLLDVCVPQAHMYLHTLFKVDTKGWCGFGMP